MADGELELMLMRVPDVKSRLGIRELFMARGTYQDGNKVTPKAVASVTALPEKCPGCDANSNEISVLQGRVAQLDVEAIAQIAKLREQIVALNIENSDLRHLLDNAFNPRANFTEDEMEHLKEVLSKLAHRRPRPNGEPTPLSLAPALRKALTPAEKQRAYRRRQQKVKAEAKGQIEKGATVFGRGP